jgi:hypothetical protein
LKREANGAEHRHDFGRLVTALAIALHLLAYVADRIGGMW